MAAPRSVALVARLELGYPPWNSPKLISPIVHLSPVFSTARQYRSTRSQINCFEQNSLKTGDSPRACDDRRVGYNEG